MIFGLLASAILSQATVRVLVPERPKDLRHLQTKVVASAMRECVPSGSVANLTKLCADRDVYVSCEIWQGNNSERCLGSYQRPVCAALAKQFVRKHSEWNHVCIERNGSRFGWVASAASGVMTVSQSEADRLVAREWATILGGNVP